MAGVQRHGATSRWRRTALAAAAVLVLPLLGVPAAVGTAAAAPPRWQPKEPPLTTPWTHLVGPNNALPEYPRPQLVRHQWKNLNGVWQFSSSSTPSQRPRAGRDLGERILVPYPEESALSGIMRGDNYLWYRRTFTPPRGWNVDSGRCGNRSACPHLMLHFGAVDYKTTVWVNGIRVATHVGGYDSFSADITRALKRNGKNELLVGVEDRTDETWQPVGKQRNVPDRGIFYTGTSGIWQSVWMEPVAAAHITRLDMTPNIRTNTLALKVRATAAYGQTVEATAYAGKRRVGAILGAPNSLLRLPVPQARLWSPDHPYLYTLKVRLLQGRKAVDKVDSYFGMRTIGLKKAADGKMRITLNGRPTFLMSTLDQGFWPDGIYTAPTDQALRFDLAVHKRLGFNTVRKHIKVEPDRWYYWADKLGLMVWQDMPAMRTGGIPPVPAQREFERQLHRMVAQHDNWTSIVGWIPFNEGWGEWSQDATGRIAQSVKAQDPSRLVDAHSGVNCCASQGDSGKGDVIDYHQYVGPATPSPTADRAAIDGEHGGFGLEVEGHMWFGEGGAYQMLPDKASLTQAYVENQQKLLAAAKQCGLSGGIYTQITDVEHEVNGFYTYDRKVKKMEFPAVRAINRKIVREAPGSGSGTTYPPGTPGLEGIHRWPADEGSGNTAADVVDDADLTLFGDATWVPGKVGTALGFGGTGYAQTDAPVVDTTGNFSVAAWVKLNATGGGFETAASQDGASSSAFFLQYDGGANKFAFSTVAGRAYANTTAQAGQWYQLVGVRDAAAGTYTLYVNGEQQGTSSQCLGDASTGPFAVGRAKYNGNNVDFFRGAVDDVRVYDRALSADEVAQLYGSASQ